MPRVGNKKYPYTPKGKEEAKKEREKMPDKMKKDRKRK